MAPSAYFGDLNHVMIKKQNKNKQDEMPGFFFCNICIELLKTPNKKCKLSLIQAGASGPIWD